MKRKLFLFLILIFSLGNINTISAQWEHNSSNVWETNKTDDWLNWSENYVSFLFKNDLRLAIKEVDDGNVSSYANVTLYSQTYGDVQDPPNAAYNPNNSIDNSLSTPTLMFWNFSTNSTPFIVYDLKDNYMVCNMSFYTHTPSAEQHVTGFSVGVGTVNNYTFTTMITDNVSNVSGVKFTFDFNSSKMTRFINFSITRMPKFPSTYIGIDEIFFHTCNYSDYGNITSQTLDVGHSNVKYENVTLKNTTLSGGSISWMVRANNTLSKVNDSVWHTDIASILENRYVQIFINFTTTNYSETPNVTSVKLNYTLGNSPPYQPTLKAPANNTALGSVSTTLQYNSTDPEGDTITYNVYLGTNPAALSLLTTTTNEEYPSGSLANSETYYWNVSAVDLTGSNGYGNQSLLYQFTTPTAPTPEAPGGGGGGGAEVIRCEIGEKNWTVSTEARTASYDIKILPGGKRERNIMLINYAPEPVNLELTCIDTGPNWTVGMCDNVELEKSVVSLPANMRVEEKVKMTFTAPKDADFWDSYFYSIYVEDRTTTCSGILAVEVTISYFGFFFKLLDTKKIQITETREIGIPIGLIILVSFFSILILLNILINAMFKKFPYAIWVAFGISLATNIFILIWI